MPSSRKRQRTLFDYANSSSPTKCSPTSIRPSSSDDGTDPGKIQFEHGVNEVEEDLPPSSLKATDEDDTRPHRYSTRSQKLQTSSAVSVDSSSSEDGMSLRTRPARFRQSHHVVSDESESQQPPKKRRLVKGKRPHDPELEAEDEDGNLIDEVDEDSSCLSRRYSPITSQALLSSVIISSRLRGRPKKSVFAKNLERLQRG
jgi:hypothetical protein